MLDFLFANENMPFTIALLVMLLIGLLEGVTTLLGFAASGLLDTLMPEADLGLDATVGDGLDLAEVGHPAALSRLLGWLHVGRVPVLILFLVFLAAFGFAGLVVQQASLSALGRMLPALLATAPALGVGVLIVRITGHTLARVLPRDETSAVAERSFVGRVATVTLGTARRGHPAQARLRDQHGQAHYVMLEPDSDADAFDAGTPVLLVGRTGRVFRAIRSPSDALADVEEV